VDAARVSEAMAGAVPGDVLEVEYRVERRDEAIWLRDRIHMVSPDRLVVETADITGERNTREAKVQSRKGAALSRMAVRLAHEFNNLLTVIYGNADSLLQRTPPGDDRAALEQILGATERAAAIGDQLRRLARTAPPRPQLFDLNEFLRRNTVGARLELSRSPEFVSVDASMLSDALRNLAVWAAERVPEGGRLTVRTARAAGPGPATVWLTLGPMAGLSEDEVERWMEPTGAAQGYDLAAAFLALEQMKTPVALQAKGDRHVFTIGFPVAAEAREASMGTILVVEDEEAVRLVVTRLLSQSGFEVIEAANGAAALRIAGTHPDPIDLLLTDVGLGDMLGTEVALRVRERFPEVKVIFMSGEADPLPGDAKAKTGDTFLPKPFRLGELLELVRKTLGEGA
jgi:CheY-like chemotaxis protein